MLDRLVKLSSPPAGWKLLMVPITLASIIPVVLLSDIALFAKGIARKLTIYSTAPGTREILFADLYLHRTIRTRRCVICNTIFWTIGESEICRKMSCYMVHKNRKEVIWPD